MQYNLLIILRIVYTLGLLGVMVFLPWYFVIIGALSGMFMFQKYIEGFVILVLLDALYGFTDSVPHMGMYAVIGVICFMIIGYLKKHLAWFS